jgi:hypothetical protein
MREKELTRHDLGRDKFISEVSTFSLKTWLFLLLSCLVCAFVHKSLKCLTVTFVLWNTNNGNGCNIRCSYENQYSLPGKKWKSIVSTCSTSDDVRIIVILIWFQLDVFFLVYLICCYHLLNRFWNGKISMAVPYWVNYVGLGPRLIGPVRYSPMFCT